MRLVLLLLDATWVGGLSVKVPSQGMKPLSIGLPVQPDVQLPKQPHAASLPICAHGAAAALPAAVPYATVPEGLDPVMTFHQDLVSA